MISGSEFAALSPTHQWLLNRITKRQKGQAAAQAQLDRTTAEVAAAVKKALDGGVPAKIVAAHLGLSVSRVYQIRDEVADVRVAG